MIWDSPFLAFAALVAMLGVGLQQLAAQEMAVPSIMVERSETGLTLIGRITALTAGRYSGHLTIVSKGASGSTSTQQSGAVYLAAGAIHDIASVALNWSDGQIIEVEFSVSTGTGKIGKTTLSLNTTD